jgi:hypothetical protein
MNELMSGFSSILLATAALLVGISALLVALRVIRFLDNWEERFKQK